jgi:hypothetical protein
MLALSRNCCEWFICEAQEEPFSELAQSINLFMPPVLDKKTDNFRAKSECLLSKITYTVIGSRFLAHAQMF